MIKQVIFSLMFLLLIGSVFAQTNFEEVKQIEGQEIPGFLKSLFSEERVNVKIVMDDATEQTIGILIAESKITQVSDSALENPTLNVNTYQQTVEEIEQSNNPFQAILNALEEGKITYSAVGFFGKIKFAFVKTFLKGAAKFMDQEETVPPVVEEEPQDNSQNEKQDQSETDEDMLNKETPETVPEEKEVEKENKVRLVKLTTDGFDRKDLDLKVGETVEWSNVREKGVTKAMIIGTRDCANIKSEIFESGESFSWTFEQPLKCTIVDGIYTTKSMNLIVS